MVRITEEMTEEQYGIALDEEMEEEVRRYGDFDRAMRDRGYDFAPWKIVIMRPSFKLAKSVQAVVDRFFEQNPNFYSVQ